MSVGFLNIEAFWAMFVLPLLVGVMLWGLSRRRKLLKEFGRTDLLAKFSRFSLGGKAIHRILPAVLCFALLIIVTARPLVYGEFKEVARGALDVVAILDVSKSMAAEDFGPAISRIEAAKNALLKSLPDLSGNRLGIVTFAGMSFPQAELTDDFQALGFVIKNWITVDSAPSYGSNIGMALSEAAALFEENDKKKVITLFSDGGHDRPKNLEAVLTDVGAKQITVVSVGIGNTNGSKIPVYENGEFKEWFKIDDKEAVTRLNDEMLKEIADATGGKYVHLSSERGLDGIFRDPAVVGKKALAGGREIFQIPLALAIGLFFLGMYFERRSA
jgi:Ca-activated chloride channel family protein